MAAMPPLKSCRALIHRTNRTKGRTQCCFGGWFKQQRWADHQDSLCNLYICQQPTTCTSSISREWHKNIICTCGCVKTLYPFCSHQITGKWISSPKHGAIDLDPSPCIIYIYIINYIVYVILGELPMVTTMYNLFLWCIPSGKVIALCKIWSISFDDLPNMLLVIVQFAMLPSGKRLHNYGKSPFWMGKSTVSMAIFNSFLYVYWVAYRRIGVIHWSIPSSIQTSHGFFPAQSSAERPAPPPVEKRWHRYWTWGNVAQTMNLVIVNDIIRTYEKYLYIYIYLNYFELEGF